MTVRVLAGGGGGSEPDDDIALVTNLIHADGSNGGTNHAFLDSSGNNHTVSTGSMANYIYQGTFSPFSAEDGKWCIQLSGTNDVMYVPGAQAGLGFGTGAYTIEMWIWVNDTGEAHLFDTTNNGFNSPAQRIRLYLDSNTRLAFKEGTTVKGSASSQIPMYQWVHVAVSRESNHTRGYVNGVQVFDFTGAHNIAAPYSTAYIGGYGQCLDGKISNVRVVKGTAVYSGSSGFTVPTEPLTAITNTQLLTCCTNRMKDKSTNNIDVTLYYMASVKPFSPFKPSGPYDPAVNGGSAFFIGSAQNALIASHATQFDFGTNDYCIEFWVYPLAVFGNWTLYADLAGTNNYWGAFMDSGLTVHTASLDRYSGSASEVPELFAWSHLVYMNTGGVNNWFINGKSVYYATDNFTHADATGIRFGASDNYNTYQLKGWMSDMRVTTGNGYNPYGNYSTLTVPTAPLTAGNYTRLLLNCTNGSIVDARGGANYQLENQAQLDTTIKKFGTASMEFDGSGDRVDAPYGSVQTSTHGQHVWPGRGPFTYECWVYPEGSGWGCIFDTGESANGLILYHNGTQFALYWNTTNTSLSVNSAFTLNQWQHVAITRDTSNNIRGFINGTQVGSTQTSNTSFNANTGRLRLGQSISGSSSFDGYIDEFRVTLKARYTSNFAAPTAAFPDK